MPALTTISKRVGTPIELTSEERSALEAIVRSPKAEHGIVERARIVLLAAQKPPNTRAVPFAWTKPVVHQKRLKWCFSDL